MEPRLVLPKGANFAAAQQWLVGRGIDVPAMSGRCYTDTVYDAERKRHWGVVYAKDADIPRKILSLGGLGLVGSDVLGELPDDQVSGLARYPIAPISKQNESGEVDVLRFVVLTRSGGAGYLQRRLRGGKTIRVGTSYPSQTARMLGGQAVITQIVAGGAESLPWEYDPCAVEERMAVDAIVELIQTDRTMRANRLELVMLPGRAVSSEAVWLEAITRRPSAVTTCSDSEPMKAPRETWVWNGLC